MVEVRCPSCDEVFEVPRGRRGARYVRKWTKLPDKNLRILKWWVNSFYVETPLSREELSRAFQGSDIYGTSGRVAELLGLNLVIKVEKKKYILNSTLVAKVIADGGKLDSIRAELNKYFDEQDRLETAEMMSHYQKGARYYK